MEIAKPEKRHRTSGRAGQNTAYFKKLQLLFIPLLLQDFGLYPDFHIHVFSFCKNEADIHGQIQEGGQPERE